MKKTPKRNKKKTTTKGYQGANFYRPFTGSLKITIKEK